MAITITPLASFDDAYNFGSGAETLRDIDNSTAQQALMLRATAALENRCQRRLAPFSGLQETYRAFGVDEGFLAGQSVPLDMPGAIGRDRAMSYSATRMVRDFWVREVPPVYSDAWQYNLQSITLLRPFNDVQLVDVGLCQGPDIDTGHVRFNLGLFCPESSTIQVVYGGGYQTIPYDLELACIFQAYKLALVGKGPESRKDVSMIDLDGEILALIAPYIRS